MPKFGICATPDKAPAIKAAGWDFIEGHVQNLFQGLVDDANWKGAEQVTTAALPVPAANCLLPGDLKVCGPAVDFDRLTGYMTRAIARAAGCGTTTLVFGSGVARNVPDAFSRDEARQQILRFSQMAAQIAAAHRVTIVYEPLNRGECNIINSVKEAMEYVAAINHPNLQCLVDSWHFWLENEPLENLAAAMGHIRHVHLADREGRVAPGQSGTSDYVPFFKTLKAGGYDGCISVEATFKDAPESYAPVLEYIQRAWNAA
ncbi:MAG TPA: sugar phosphate isomerase/epimerase family protein [Tepidisphaeraceae bacterium]|nr:sugar phosphate isomerase/epimerase family protein [Tepidisphaeraceae bacterium]